LLKSEKGRLVFRLLCCSMLILFGIWLIMGFKR
jgi:hypothetical protein